MDKQKQKSFNDYLEVITFFIFILILLVVYIPSTIWEEEDAYKNESRFRMQNIYDIERFYNQLKVMEEQDVIKKYEEDGLKALRLVNAVRDSLTADSLFLGDQMVYLGGEPFQITVPKGFDVEYDTTFGLRSVEKEIVTDTTLTLLMYNEEGIEDTVFIQNKELPTKKADPSFIRIADKTVIEVSMPNNVEIVEESFFGKIKGLFGMGAQDEVPTTEPLFITRKIRKENFPSPEISDFPLEIQFEDILITIKSKEEMDQFTVIEDSEEIVPAIDYTKRTETVAYFETQFKKERDPYDFIASPDSSQFNCPLTGEPYIIEIIDDRLRVSSPITRPYRENRYGFFSLKARNHGYIIDGTRSWDN
tara:strand:+ start:1788 stop:2873 length:1086 start_codon:yes stop_codon:yes gene_type:complete